MKILFVVPYAPTRIRTRPFHLFRALAAAGHEVTVATLWSSADEREAVAGIDDGTRTVAESLPARRRLWNCLRAVPGREPLQAHYSWSPRLARRLRAMVLDTPYDAIHVEHLRGVRYGLDLLRTMSAAGRPRPVVVWDSVDCITSLFRRAARESQARRVRVAARFELPRTARFEPAAAAAFDRVLVTSAIDQRELLRLAAAPGRAALASRMEVLPNGVDLEYFRPTGEPREVATLVVTGKMSYHANATAVVRFVREVMPAVWSGCAAARLWIVGKDPTAEVVALGESRSVSGAASRSAAPPRVVVTGTVDDIRPYLRKATLAVAPIQYGVGIQNKVLEAMACGTPVVATRQAVSAVDARHGADLAVASDGCDLANAILRLLRSPQERACLGQAGRAFVERHHDWHVLGARLASIYHDACN